MKAGSEFKTNPISRVAKKPMAPFGIIAKFRASIAFSSLGKLFILTLISSLAMSSLIFGFTINGKFDTAIAKTADTRNYAFQVDLYSPTSQGGQYIPINDDSFGKSGFDSKENCLLPSLYFDNEIGGDENA
ncbi:MAG: hypothetical protein K2M43_00270 [Mycoplasmoidaceae bacterium]|nr:hypothetical protein [Mycoplasmoidaceae bacterium]